MKQHDTGLEDFLEPLRISPAKLCSLARSLSQTYCRLMFESSEQFLATPVTRLPSGEEHGEHLAIDFGGTNLRIAFITLDKDNRDVAGRQPDSHYERSTMNSSQGWYRQTVTKCHERSWPIGDHLKVEKAEDLFAWVGDCLAEVITARLANSTGSQSVPDEIPLGIAFSFPMM